MPTGEKRKSGGSQAPARSKVPKRLSGHPSIDQGPIEDEGNADSRTLDELPFRADPTSLLDPMIDPPDSSGSELDDEDELELEGENVEEEDIEDEASAADEVSSSAGPSRPPQRKPNGLYRPPTLEEMDTLQAASEKGGNSFSLQLDALLASTLLPKDPQPRLKELLSEIHSTIMNLPSLPPLSPKKAVKRLKGNLTFPGPDEFSPLTEDVQWRLGWEKPEEIFVGGSWSICGGYKMGKREMGDIDIFVVMPDSLFSPKDRMSFRYFHKRAHYLAVIKAALQNIGKESDLRGCKVDLSAMDGDTNRTKVVLTAGKEQGLKYQVKVNICAAISPSLFPPSTLHPTKSLLRHSSIPPDSPTPIYATSIAHDTLPHAYLSHLNRLSHSLTGNRVVDSFLVLWRIWTNRRGVHSSRGGDDEFATMLLSWVVQGGHVGGMGGDRSRMQKRIGLGKGLSCWAALRAAWEFLAHADFANSPVFLACDEPPIRPDVFLASFTNVLVDHTGTINVFAGWNESDVQLLQNHAREMLAMLEDDGRDLFAEVFLKNHSLDLAGFDEVIVVDAREISPKESLLQQAERPEKMARLASALEDLLRRGLTDRAKMIHCVVDHDRPGYLRIGVLYDPSNATRLLDVGPSSGDSSKGESFRELWGEKAELRRFKDGSISESVVWEVSRPEEAALIPGRIVRWLLKRNFGLDEDRIVGLSSDQAWLDVIQVPALARDAIAAQGAEKLGFRPMMDAYEDLVKLLKGIDSELPLAILQVQPASDLLRYSSTFVPHPLDTARFTSAPDSVKWIPRAEIILQFESSPRWPDDLGAIQKVKLALLEKLARIITTQRRGSTARIVFESGRSDVEDSAGLEIFLPAGIAFLIRIYHERERTLLERVINDEIPTAGTSLPLPPKRLALPAMALHLPRFLHLPQHHSAIAPLHHRYPSLSTATRLLKRWFAAHMLSQISTEAIELLMVSIYLDPGSLQRPASAPAAFTRAMTLLANWDWRSDPLVLPPFSTVESGRPRMPVETRTQIVAAFEELRRKDKDIHHGAWVIATEQDVDGLRWTKQVNKLVASRVRKLARATLDTLTAGSLNGMMDVKTLFTTLMEDYDVLLHLNPSLLPRSTEAVDWQSKGLEDSLRFRNVRDSVYGEGIRIAFDPHESFALDVQELYGDAFMVFFDRHGGSVIGLVWNPAKQTPRAFKPFLEYSSSPTESEAALVSINREAVLGEIARLGNGLIRSISLKQAGENNHR